MTTIGQLQSEYQKLHIRLEYITQLLYCRYFVPFEMKTSTRLPAAVREMSPHSSLEQTPLRENRGAGGNRTYSLCCKQSRPSQLCYFPVGFQ